MTYGELVTRLCQLRDEMHKTEPGRAALRDVERRLGFSQESYEDYGDEPVEWVKEEPEKCEICRQGPFELFVPWHPRRFPTNFCPMCGRDLR